jgi:hypothetical protein
MFNKLKKIMNNRRMTKLRTLAGLVAQDDTLREFVLEMTADSMSESDIASYIDASDVAEHVEISHYDIAMEMDSYSIACELDVYDIADALDSDSVAEHITVSPRMVADHIDLDDLSMTLVGHIDYADIAGKIKASVDEYMSLEIDTKVVEAFDGVLDNLVSDVIAEILERLGA